jgi:hypothetical protein
MNAAEACGALAYGTPRFGTDPALLDVPLLIPQIRTAAVAVAFFGSPWASGAKPRPPSNPVVKAQDASGALPTMHLTGPVPDLGARVDQAIAQLAKVP